ncbi:MAG: gliding motility-associated C-terminal domain-containing protein [Bacteroidetes bacterium]|nr:gliding motility-associated C-terminal domain-containing protein [Bacteroidota bacterium]
MKKNLPCLLLTSYLLPLTAVFPQTNQTKFQNIYNLGTSGNGFFVPNATRNSTNGYITMGWVYGASSQLFPAGMVFETDTMGNVKWARKYKGDNTFGFTPLIISDFLQTGGNYVATGNRNSRALLMKFVPNSSTVNFSNTYSTDGWGDRVKEDGSGNLVVAGGSQTKSAMNPDKDSTSIYIFKTNSTGTYQWGRSYTLTSPVFDSFDEATDVVTVPTGYVFTGYHSENNGADTTTNILIFMTDFSGNLQWMRSYGSLSTNEDGRRIIYDSGNNQFVIMGFTDAASGFGDVFILRTDASGNYITSTAYGTNVGIAEPSDFVHTKDGGYAIIGWAAIVNAITYRPFLVKLDAAFNHQFTKYYKPSTLGGFFTYGEEATNGGYILGSMAADGTYGGWATELIKTDSQGKTDNTSTSCSESNYVPIQRTYVPAMKTIIPTVRTGGSGSSFSQSNSSFNPATTFTCMVCAKPSANVSPTSTSICAGNSVVLTASGGGTYSWNTGAASASITVSPATTTSYSCWVSAIAGCDSVVVATVNVNSAPTINITGNNTICQGQFATLTASGGGTYSWSNSSTSPTIVVNPTSTVIYSVTVTGANGCTGTSSITVNVISTPTASISAASAICSGNSVTLTASGGGNYSWWNNGAASATITDNPTSTTTYTVTVSNGSCSSTTTATVNVNQSPAASISGSNTICVGYVVTLTASGGGTYSWNTGQTSATITDNPASATTYSVVVTAANGCTNTASVTVNVLATPTASVSGNNTICSGQSATLTASGGGNYLWSPGGQTTASIIVSPASNTTYSVTVSAGSCSDATSILVSVNPTPSATISGNTSICQGQNVSLTASGGGTYSWSTGATSASITDNPTSNTSYTVIISNGQCASAAVANVTVLSTPTASITASSFTICSGTSATLTASGGGNYLWSPGGQTTSSIIVSPVANTNYSVTVSNGNCTDAAIIAVAVNTSPTASVTATSNSICLGQSATLTASGGGTYVWNPGGQTSNVITVSPTINSSYTVTVTSANGCTASATSNVAVNSIPAATISASGATICSGASTTLTASGGANYSWSSGQTTPVIVVSPSSTTNYTVTVSNGNCSSDTNITVNVNPSPTASVSATSNAICSGQSATLTASGGGTYLWNPTGQTSNSISVSPTANTSYTVTVTAANGCTASVTSTVSVTPVPNPSVTSTGNTICSGSSVTLSASGGTTYVWNPGGSTTSSIVVSPTSNTTYTLTAANGTCTATATATVNVNPSPSATSAGVSVNYGSNTTISASASGGTSPYSYLWNTGDVTQTISVSPVATTDYCVIITDANNCSDSACATVTVEYVCGDLFIPDAFSPNGDGHNDYFVPRDICFRSFHLTVYDRWGENVFETDDIYTKGWDGIYHGKTGETAVFSYYFSYELVNGDSGVKKGTVTLLR